MKRRAYISEVPFDEAGSDDRSIYLTFDDGPNPHCTGQILDVLAEHSVSATFFVLGAYVKDHPNLVRRIAAEGHLVANHTMTHPDLTACDPEAIEREINEANKAIVSACPQAAVQHIRAPYGAWNEDVLSRSMNAGLRPVHWSIDPKDWSRPGADSIVDAVLAAARPGATVLLHDGCPPDEVGNCKLTGLRDQTLSALLAIIPALHSRGFSLRSLPQ
ncbi:chitooligosaccharide deacetylase NodB [Rhizobium ruizarguesonis]|uniref:chitooligosaccharide deacetylase NodB n=1 Tax=Rhizobium ruizarguesonis TaxID=2081791 RepID=UPI001031BF19|nr:chitooligosaccharide deacetylase NodB [Rhizobium ruizarguesonis]TAW62108.1 chitooligosaccharide deacetylase NodB [Rhizobium ruizarguesonis]TAX02985.1 chitooligosaccharide deacetylase NodB [Rhizobium ruizarguesonis]TBA13782.1 chitooligosaccharide deacetylase NodB [Rhizobium ruizarguesonis]TBA52402.1 chitooligosaccharide deacetylase NodB [Rhizobium ruizarguesonis]